MELLGQERALACNTVKWYHPRCCQEEVKMGFLSSHSLRWETHITMVCSWTTLPIFCLHLYLLCWPTMVDYTKRVASLDRRSWQDKTKQWVFPWQKLLSPTPNVLWIVTRLFMTWISRRSYTSDYTYPKALRNNIVSTPESAKNAQARFGSSRLLFLHLERLYRIVNRSISLYSMVIDELAEACRWIGKQLT